MAIKHYQFLCEHCGYKRITDGSDIQDLREIKTSPIPRGVPQLDQHSKVKRTPVQGQQADITTKVNIPSAQNQIKKFKCPKCGYAIKAKQIKLAEYDVDEQANRTDGRETSIEGPSIPGESTT